MKLHPYGNIDPFKIPEIADRVLNDCWNIAEDLKIQTFLLYGTCLGFVRDGGYIEGDNDIDIGVLEGLDVLTEGLIINGFVNKRTLGTATRHFFKDGILLDVWFGFFSRDFLQSFDKVEYKGRFFNVPHPVEEFLSASYGNWRIRVLNKKALRC